MINITSTKAQDAHFLKVLVHAPAGSGKTRLCSTVPNNLIISAEAGLLSLKDYDIDVVTVKTMDDMRKVYEYLATDTKYEWISLDSISEIAEVCLAEEKAGTKDPRKAYGEMQEQMMNLMRAYRDLPKNVYFSAKQDRQKDESTGSFFYGAMIPGQKLGQALPYMFDEVLCLQVWKDEEGVTHRAFQTERDEKYDAKDRSGKLDSIEPADLGAIYQKIMTKKS